VSKSLKKAILEMWFHGENEPFNAEFIYNNIPVKRMLVQIIITK
jgi:hypothetical protein